MQTKAKKFLIADGVYMQADIAKSIYKLTRTANGKSKTIGTYKTLYEAVCAYLHIAGLDQILLLKTIKEQEKTTKAQRKAIDTILDGVWER